MCERACIPFPVPAAQCISHPPSTLKAAPVMFSARGRPWRRPWSTSRPCSSCGRPRSAVRQFLRRTICSFGHCFGDAADQKLGQPAIHHHLEARRRIIANPLIDRPPDLVSPAQAGFGDADLQVRCRQSLPTRKQRRYAQAHQPLSPSPPLASPNGSSGSARSSSAITWSINFGDALMTASSAFPPRKFSNGVG
jgi:hypothetical protein